MMSTYFVYYTAHLTTGDKDRNILVNSDRSGRELYRQIQDAIDVKTFFDAAGYTIKNIVCLDNIPGICTWKNNKDGESIDWESIATIAMAEMDAAERAALIAQHTAKKTGNRVLRITAKGF